MTLIRLVPLAATLTVCCGYSSRSLLPSHLRTIGFEPIENLTLQPEFTDLLDDGLREEFAHDRRLRVTTLEGADVVLRVQLVSYSKEADAYTGDQRISSYRLSAAAALSAQDKIRGEALYSGNVSAQFPFNPDAATEEAASDSLMTRLAKEAVRVLLLAW